MTLRLQAYCEANLQSKYDVKIGNLENITAGWESEIYAFALEHGRQSKRIREELVLRLYSGEGAGEKSAHEFQSIKRLREVGYPVPQVVVWTASGYRRPSSFLGEGGHKLFLDRIWSDLRFAFQADHRRYRATGSYDFPQRKIGLRLLNLFVPLVRLPFIRKRFVPRIKDSTVIPLRRVVVAG